MKFSDIPKFTRDGNYRVDISLHFLEDHVLRFITNYRLNIDSDFQRAHVWTDEQAIAFVEHLFKGGKGSNILRFNHPGWMRNFKGEMTLVDGKQRLTACLRFLNNELPVFGYYLKDYEDEIPFEIGFVFQVNDLPTKSDVLKWYLEINTGGTDHTPEEIQKVEQLLKEEDKI